MKILILNSDSPNNRGDRPILAGNIALIRQKFPSAIIYAQSQYPERDRVWFGIEFLPFDPYTVNPLNLLRLMRFARQCKYIFWGGGEILKDYTNKIGLFYWAAKIVGLWIVNKNIYGAFQGIGPATGGISRRLISFTVNRCRAFIVRDSESKKKLESWGVSVPVISSFDPALLLRVGVLNPEVLKRIKETYGISDLFLKRAMGVGVRRWFHYSQGGVLPFHLAQAIRPLNRSRLEVASYAASLARDCDFLIEKYNINILFFPMHMGKRENDIGFSAEVVALMKQGSRARVIDRDDLSPQDFLDLIGRCKGFIASRLHSAILATSANVPSLMYYYIEKGRLYFEQLGLSEFCYPIEDLLGNVNDEVRQERIERIIGEGNEIKLKMPVKIQEMRAQIEADFGQALSQMPAR